MMPSISTDFAAVIAQLRTTLALHAPELLADYDTYAGEALFGREWLDMELKQLSSGSPVLEVGAGMFLLACQLQREGYAVTALEPIGSGFAHFSSLQQWVLQQAKADGCMPQMLSCAAEDLTLHDNFSFAYSLNVMEHVADVGIVMQNVLAALKPTGRYRFVCPNYSFPFETHFRIPILVNKCTTLKLFENKIFHATHMEDPKGVWKSLNWITVRKLVAITKAMSITPLFNRGILNLYLDRALRDPSFCARHPFINRVIKTMSRLGLLNLLRIIPTRWTPIIDCSVTRV